MRRVEILTWALDVYVVLFLSMVVSVPPRHIDRFLRFLLPVHIAFALLSFALAFFFISRAARNPFLSVPARAAWIAAFLVLPLISFHVYIHRERGSERMGHRHVEA